MKKSIKVIISFILIVIIFLVSFEINYANAETSYEINLDNLNGKLVIIHTNDTHGFLFNNTERTLDIEYLKKLRDIFEAAGAEVLLVDAGDTLFGTPMFTQKKLWNQIVERVNEVQFDVMTTGNHDFDYGGEKLIEVMTKLTVPLVVSNLIYTATNKTVTNRYHIIEKGNKKIGLFGITSPEVITGFDQYNDTTLSLTNPIIAAKEVTKKLKKENVDYIIALGHIGMDQRSELTSLDVISEAPDIDLFIDAHSHYSLKLRLIHDNFNQTLLVRNMHYFTELGVVVVDDDGYMHPYTLQKKDIQKLINISNKD